MLKLVKGRQLRQRLLSILNFNRSIQKMLVVDAKNCNKPHYPKHSNAKDGANIDFNKDSSSDIISSQLAADYHAIGSDGITEVRNQKGQLIMHAAALSDLEDLEDQLLCLGTMYINKHVASCCDDDAGFNINNTNNITDCLDYFEISLNLLQSEYEYQRYVTNTYISIFHTCKLISLLLAFPVLR